ncbi:autotransporter domain-containing protein [Phyllobacterium endophyticum]|uniref:autotransporter domain-containing protein n=1 Tax=Phyllobacterium endophyticum TaxID=1149773 RepID=UPI0011CAC655|nr:autotransporter domain-containing protein [Phyllobacterium endophyticum]TXR50923.1 autotransporter domain-containing protein [Phyllobacterium endophyticum]
MKKFTKAALASVATMALVTGQPGSASSDAIKVGGQQSFLFDRNVTFGDSLSDNGSLAADIKSIKANVLLMGTLTLLLPDTAKLLGKADGMAGGRASNGRVWIEYIVSKQDRGIIHDPNVLNSTLADAGTSYALGLLPVFLGGKPFILSEYLKTVKPIWNGGPDYGYESVNGKKSVNYAVAGSKFLPSGPLDLAIPTLASQVDAFMKPLKDKTKGFGKNDLVTVWEGANDAFGLIPAKGKAMNQADFDKTVAASKAALISNLEKLYAAGGRNFLIPNLPDFGLTPDHRPNAENANKASGAFVKITAEAIDEFRAKYADAIVYAPELRPAITLFNKSPQVLGFNNVTIGCQHVPKCKDRPVDVPGFLNEQNKKTDSAGKIIDVQNEYVFWDGVHPNTRAHAYLASYFEQYWLNPDLKGAYLVSPEGLFKTRRHFLFPAADLVMKNYLEGDAALYKLEKGKLVITGDNTYTGGTIIEEGTLQIGDGKATGSITGDVTTKDETILAFDRSDLIAFDGAIIGTGSVQQNGTGGTLLTGKNTYTGDTIINGGLLAVNGSLTSKVLVNGTGILGGNGSIGSLVANNGGWVSPGNSVGKLTVAGDATFDKGSVFDVEIRADKSAADQLDVKGKVILLGGVVQTRIEGTPAFFTADQVKGLFTKPYEILLAGKGVTGTFENAKQYKYLTTQLDYSADRVSLRFVEKAQPPVALPVDIAIAEEPKIDPPALPLAPTHIHVGYDAVTQNQKAVAGAIDKMQAGDAIYNTVLFTRVNAIPNYDALSGEVHATLSGVLIEDNHFISDAASARVRTAFGGVTGPDQQTATPLAFGPGGKVKAKGSEAFDSVAPAPATTALWGQAYGAWAHADANGNAAGYSRKTGGLVTGFDGVVAETWRFGLLAGYGNSSVSGGRGRALVDSYQLGLYGGTQIDAFGLRLGVNLAQHEIDSRRRTDFGALLDRHSTKYEAQTVQVFGELGYEINTAYADFEPFAGASYVHLKTDSFQEDGAISNLTGLSSTSDVTITTLGLRGSHAFALTESTILTARGLLGWNHAFGDVTPESRLAFTGGQSFTAKGLPIAEDAAVVEAGLDLGLGRNTTLGLTYTGQFSAQASDNAVKADLSVRF